MSGVITQSGVCNLVTLYLERMRGIFKMPKKGNYSCLPVDSLLCDLVKRLLRHVIVGAAYCHIYNNIAYNC